jgi:prepilin-type N-terminal cleavage/methylation domain-containing protein
MNRSALLVRGFTLIELMVSLAVMLVLVAIAQPSFEGLRQRSAIRGAGEQVLGFWNQARLEAAKRNQMDKVGALQMNGGAGFCLGAAVAAEADDDTPCDCRQAAPSSDVCDIARFPADQSEWKGVFLAGMTLGGGTLPTLTRPAVIEPKRTSLVVPADDGSLTLAIPPGRFQYRLNLHVDRFGRARLCESTLAPDHLAEYGTRRCAD